MPFTVSERTGPMSAKVASAPQRTGPVSPIARPTRSMTTVLATSVRSASSWEARMAPAKPGRARATNAFSRNHETDENPSTGVETGVSAIRPLSAKVRENARVIAPSSQP